MKKMLIFVVLFISVSFSNSLAEMNGDFDQNGKIGLEDSIGILQVVSGKIQDSEWTLYDDFSSGTISSDLWVDTNQLFTVEDGKAKVVHSGGYSTLYFIDPLNIEAVKVTVRIASCTGDFRARLMGNNGKDGEGNYFLQALQLKNVDDTNGYGNYSLAATNKLTDADAYFLLYYNIHNPIEIINRDFIFELSFTSNIRAKVSGLGTVNFIPEPEILPDTIGSDKYGFRIGIGCRDSGSGIVYFDDVYVKYRSKK